MRCSPPNGIWTERSGTTWWLGGDALEEVIDYELIGGNWGSLPRYMIITHLAVHGGFHRGFIGDMFGQVPVVPAGQDIPVWERGTRDG